MALTYEELLGIQEKSKKEEQKNATTSKSSNNTTGTSTNKSSSSGLISKYDEISPVKTYTPNITTVTNVKPIVTVSSSSNKSNAQKLITPFEEISPLKTFTPNVTSTTKAKSTVGNLFSDGYDYGDITKTILGTAKSAVSAIGTKPTVNNTISSFDQSMMNKYSSMSLSQIDDEYKRVTNELKLFKNTNGGKLYNYIAKAGASVGVSSDQSGSALSDVQQANANIDKINDLTRELEILNMYRKQRATEEYLGGLNEEQIQMLDKIADGEASENIAPFYLTSSGADPNTYYDVTSVEREAAKQSRETLRSQLKDKNPGKTDEELDEIIDDMVELRKSQRNAEDASSMASSIKEYATEHPVISSILSRGLNLFGGVTDLSELYLQRDNKYGLDTNAPGFALTNTSNEIDEQVQLDHDWKIGEVDAFDFFYKAGTGIVDNIGRLAMSGGNSTVAGAMMFAQGTTQSIIEGKEKGYSDAKALALGLLDGTFEAISEKLSLDAILGSNGGALKTLAKSFVSEGSEELTSNWLNRIADEIANGNHSELSKKYEAYKRAGYSDSQALAEVVLSTVGEDIESFLIGGFAGAVMGGGVAVSNAVSNASQKNAPIKLTENEQKVVDKVVEDQIAKEKEDGNKVTKKKEAEIRNAVLSDMQKGYIDTDTIESVLGGEEYESYKKMKELSEGNISSGKQVIKNLEDAKKKLQKEYDALYKMKIGEKSDEQIDRQNQIKEQIANIDAEIEKTTGVIDKLSNDKKLSDLKAELDANVYELVKGSKLEETYLESTRRGETFKADLTKYDSKQQATIKSAIESGILNNSNRTHEFVDMIAKISADKGVSFDFTSNEKIKASGFAVEGRTVNGYVTGDGNVAININSAKALNSVVGHEITHILEGTELYSELQTMLKAYAESKGEYQARYDEISKLYESIENADIDKELTADLVGDYLFTDSDFINRLSTEKPGVFKKIFDEIKYLCRVAASGSKEAKELEKVKRVFEKAYRESVDVKNTAEGGVNTKYSLSANAESELHKALYDKNYRNEVLLRDETPSIMLSQKGVKNHKMVMNASHIRENVFTEAEARNMGLKIDGDTHYHGLGEETFLKIIDSLDNVKEAYRGTKYAKMSSRRENYFLLVSEFKDENGNTINVPVYIEEGAICNRVYLTSNKIATVFGKDDFRDYINKQIKNKNLVRIKNKNGTFSEGGVPLTPAYESTVLDNSISDSAENVKQKQLEIIEKVNPAPNTYNTWIRKVEDIKTLAETLEDSDWADGDEFNPDLTRGMIEEAIESGEISVYSSYPIEQGVFVSPSYMEAASYSGDGNVYEKKVSIDDVAWIDPTQGMYANTAENYSLSSKNTTPKQYGDYAVYGEDVMLQPTDDVTPVREDVAPSVIAENATPTEQAVPAADDFAPVKTASEEVSAPAAVAPTGTDDVATPVMETAVSETNNATEDIAPIRTTAEKVSAMVNNANEELRSVQKAKDDVIANYSEKIAKAQAEYDSKKDKDTKVAQTLLRRIERLKRLQKDFEAEYSKRISSVEARVEKLSAQMPGEISDKTANAIEQLRSEESKKLNAKKKALAKEYAEKKANLEAELKDKDSFVSNRAMGFYEEIRGLKKGVRASDELGYFLDLGFDWAELKSTFLKVSRFPDKVLNPDSAVESVVRESIGSEYEDRLYELDELESEYNEQLENLVSGSQKKFERAEADAKTRTDDEEILGESQVTPGEPKKKKDNSWSDFVRNFVSKGSVFETFALKTNNRAVEDKYKMWKDRSEAKAQYFMENGKGNTKSLKAIRDQITKSGLEKEFDLYMKHRLNVDRMQEDKPVFGYDITAEASLKTAGKLQQAHPEFKEWAKDVYAYNDSLRQMMVDGGLLSQETADLWAKKYPNYVPVERITDETVKQRGRGVGISAPLKKATGGTEKMETLLNTLAHRTTQVFKAVDKNAFGVELKNALYTDEVVSDVSADEIIDSLPSLDDNALIKPGEDGNPPTFTVYENGRRVTFDITENMFKALQPASDGMSKTFKIPHTSSSWLKKVLTEYNLFFTARNFPKDAQEVIFNSKHAAKTYASMPQALGELLTGKGKYVQEYWENGGKSNTYFDRNTNAFESEKGKIKKALGFVPDGISKVNDIVEAIPRLAEYIASRKKGATVEAAMLDSARVTTDFSDGGDITKFLNRNGVTFLNASVQGAAQQFRNMRQAKAEGFKGVMKLIGKYALSGLPVLLFNNLIWDDDDEYEKLSEYVKDNYYVIAKYGDGQFVRIPKGRTAAVIQDAVEQISRAVTGEKTDWLNCIDLLITNLAPNNPIDNNIFAPLIQAKKGETWYGEDLVPSRLQDLPAAEQYDETIDSISKWLGENTGISPYKINYVLNQYSGFVGDMILPALTPEAESGNNSLLSNMIAPLKDQFTVDSVLKNNNPSDFFSLSDELKINSKSKNATDEDKLKYKYISSVSSEISDLYKQQREIQNSNLSDDLKFNQVRELQRRINELAGNAIEKYEDLKIDKKYAKVAGVQYRLNDDGEWQKITDEQLEKQNEVIGILGITPGEYWSNKDVYDMKALKPDLYKVLQDEGISVKEYKEKYEQWIHLPNDDFSWAANNPEKATFSKAFYDSVLDYRAMTDELYAIRADKDENGNSISGTAKSKKQEYIWNLDIPEGAKHLLFRSEYNSYNDYNVEIIDYVDGLNLTFSEKKTILEEAGFTVDDAGNVSW